MGPQHRTLPTFTRPTRIPVSVCATCSCPGPRVFPAEKDEQPVHSVLKGFLACGNRAASQPVFFLNHLERGQPSVDPINADVAVLKQQVKASLGTKHDMFNDDLDTSAKGPALPRRTYAEQAGHHDSGKRYSAFCVVGVRPARVWVLCGRGWMVSAPCPCVGIVWAGVGGTCVGAGWICVGCVCVCLVCPGHCYSVLSGLWLLYHSPFVLPVRACVCVCVHRTVYTAHEESGDVYGKVTPDMRTPAVADTSSASAFCTDMTSSDVAAWLEQQGMQTGAAAILEGDLDGVDMLEINADELCNLLDISEEATLQLQASMQSEHESVGPSHAGVLRRPSFSAVWDAQAGHRAAVAATQKPTQAAPAKLAAHHDDDTPPRQSIRCAHGFALVDGAFAKEKWCKCAWKGGRQAQREERVEDHKPGLLTSFAAATLGSFAEDSSVPVSPRNSDPDVDRSVRQDDGPIPASETSTHSLYTDAHYASVAASFRATISVESRGSEIQSAEGGTMDRGGDDDSASMHASDATGASVDGDTGEYQDDGVELAARLAASSIYAEIPVTSSQRHVMPIAATSSQTPSSQTPPNLHLEQNPYTTYSAKGSDPSALSAPLPSPIAANGNHANQALARRLAKSVVHRQARPAKTHAYTAIDDAPVTPTLQAAGMHALLDMGPTP